MRKSPRILITAGPTIEPIDPVRFISNRSTGYMGYELARQAGKRGYKVTLISGPSIFKAPSGIKLIQIETTRQLCKKVHTELKKSDILIMSSAVSDFRTRSALKNKIKSKTKIALKLIKNPDILKSITKKERKNKIIAGFSLETENLLANALTKLRKKRLDLIVANKSDSKNIPFGKGAKTVYLLDKLGRRKKLQKLSKTRIARAILDTMEELCYTPN